MSGELVIIRYRRVDFAQNGILAALVEEGKIIQFNITPETDENILGNIYMGKVQNVVKNIKSAFIEIQKDRVAFLPLKEEILTPGKSIMVQVVGEALKTKPPKVSTDIEISGRYIVVCSDKKGDVHISKKITQKSERKRLKDILSDYTDETYGMVVRTNAAGEDEINIRNEIEELTDNYRQVIKKSEYVEKYNCLYKADKSYLKIITDTCSESLKRIVTDDEEIYNEIRSFLKKNKLFEKYDLHMFEPEEGKPDAVYNISRSLDRALNQRVWLKSGGYLVIQPTEALVSIDVNTGKSISGKKDVEKSFLKTNTEAAYEIARQLRLRNLSGIIIVDFIDMKLRENRDKIFKILKKEVSKDPVQTTVVDMTELGLVEMTRKKLRKPLEEQVNALIGHGGKNESQNKI